MKTKLLSIISIAVLLAGCNTPQSARMTAQTATTLAATIALMEAPEVRPYLAGASPVICAAAMSGTNSPTTLIANLEEVPEKNQYAALLVNTLLSGWIILYDNGDPTHQAVLLGTCDGLNMALSAAARGRLSAPGTSKLPPHLKLKAK